MAGEYRYFKQSPLYVEQQWDRYRWGAQSDQNNFQIESPHSVFVRLHPTDLFVPHRNPSRRADPSVSFHVLFLSNGKTEHSSKDLFSKNKFTVDHENPEKSKCSK
jgi:hypothetical protein